MPRLVLVFIFCLPCAILGWQWWEVWQAAPRYLPQEIHLTLARGEQLVLGRQELAALQADVQHLRLRRDEQGQWWGSNASRNKALLTIAEGQAFDDVLHLQTGSVVQMVDSRLQVLKADQHELLLSISENGRTQTWRYDGRELTKLGAPRLPACPHAQAVEKLARWGNALFAMRRTLQIGGSVACDMRLPLAALAPLALQIRLSDVGFVLQGQGANLRSQICVGEAPCGFETSWQAREFPISAGGKLVLGRSHFSWGFSANGDELHLRPERRIAWFASNQASPELAASAQAANAKLAWTWQELSPWRWPFAISPLWLLASLVPAVGLFILLARHRAWRPVAKLCSHLAVLLVAILSYFAVRSNLGHAWFLALFSLSLLLSLTSLLTTWARPPLRKQPSPPAPLPQAGEGGMPVQALFLCLISLGLLHQQMLGQLSLESNGIRFFNSYCALASVALALLQLWRSAAPWRLASGQSERALLAFALLALLAMLLEVVLGNEAGLGRYSQLNWPNRL